MTYLLIVEDNEEILDVLTRLLVRRGYEVASAVDGAMAVERIRLSSESPDLILMDLRLPIMNGWDAIAAIRAHGATMPIIALSGDSSDEDRSRAMTAGANRFMTKPVPINDLSTAIDELIETARSKNT